MEKEVIFIKLGTFGGFNLNYVFMNFPILELLLIKLVKQEYYYVNINNIFSAYQTKQQSLKHGLLH